MLPEPVRVKVEACAPLLTETITRVNDPLAFWNSPVPALMVAVPFACEPPLVTTRLAPEYVAEKESPSLNVKVRDPASVPVLVPVGVMVPDVLKLVLPKGDAVPVPELW